jgi:hypothetical protein
LPSAAHPRQAGRAIPSAARKHKYDLDAIFADLKAWEKKHVKRTIVRDTKARLRATER